MIIPFAAGGPSDVLGRNLAIAMGKQLAQPIVVENIGGAGGNIGVARAAKAAPDGYTVLMHNIGMSLSPALYRKLDYDPLADFQHLGLIAYGSMALVARGNFPARDFKEFLAYVKANREKLSFANTGLGGPSHLCGLLFMSSIQTQFTTVPYKGTGPAMNDLVGAQVDLSCDSVTTAARQIAAGKIKVYGVTGKTRAPALPAVPTLEEQGLQGFEIVTWQALYAPRNTPKPIVDRLVLALQAALSDAEFRTSLSVKLGYEPVTRERATPAALQAYLKSEIDKWGAIIKKAGIYAD